MKRTQPKSPIEAMIADWRKLWPPTFLGTELDERSAGCLKWSTTQNRRSRKEIPDDCFVRDPHKIFVRTDPFLDWYEAWLKAPRPPVRRPPPPLRRPRARAAE
jgi:hypothetical protein